MPKKEKVGELRENSDPAETAGKMGDSELEGVSGGYWGVTLIDTCPNRYDFEACYNRWGECPNLIVHRKDISYEGRMVKISLLCSCKKGCYTGVSDFQIDKEF
jgi:hypothetical protein